MRKEIEGGGRVGFAQFDREMTFSPAKNSRDSGIEGEAKGSKSTGTLTSAESEVRTGRGVVVLLFLSPSPLSLHSPHTCRRRVTFRTLGNSWRQGTLSRGRGRGR